MESDTRRWQLSPAAIGVLTVWAVFGEVTLAEVARARLASVTSPGSRFDAEMDGPQAAESLGEVLAGVRVGELLTCQLMERADRTVEFAADGSASMVASTAERINTVVARVGQGGVVDQMLPLAGFTVGVTAARRAEELIGLLERRGAKCIHAPSIRLVPLADDTELLAATRSCLQAPPDFVVATTGVGFRGWLEASAGWGLSEPLLEVLGKARLLARGPKALGAMRAVGLREEWSPASESSSEVLEYLLEAGVEGKRVVVQLHGEPLPDVIDALRLAGAEVVQVPVYRWLLPKDTAPMRRMVTAVVSGNLDAVTFTSAPAASALIRVAAEEGLEAELIAAFRGPVMAVAVGPVTAGPLLRRGINPRVASRSRLGGLVREVVDALPAATPVLPVAGGLLQVRGTGAVVDDQLVSLPRAPMQVLRMLASRPGHVLTRTDLLAALPSADDEHAVELAVTRIRAALGPRTVQTILKRGYRLAYEPERLGS